ncbi:MAG: hypothetical protein J3R72DRAFT_435222 [Linnemannia gamsii]|nr:MAG: hypothetical protein J3R72DRAFT_435222 [Linnemannia gamsii]
MIAAKAFQTLFFFLAVLVMLGASSVDAAPAKGNNCIQCFAPPKCPPSCPLGQKCHLIEASCHSCGSGECVPL